jgi:transposase
MNILKLTQQKLDELHEELTSNPEPQARKKSLVVYLRAMGIPRNEVAKLARVDEDTVTNYVKKYLKGGLKNLIKNNYRSPKSKLEPHIETLKKLFKDNPPHTINQAIEMILKHTGVHIKNSACRCFLKSIGMKFRRCGLVPGKANSSEKQCKLQK